MSALELTTDRALATGASSQQLVMLGLDAASAVTSMVEWAAREAIACGGALQIVTCSGASCSTGSCTARRGPALTEAIAAARKSHPMLTIEETAVRLCTATEFVDQAVNADLLIVGEPYLGISTRRLLDSTAGTAVRRTSCPVIALRGRQRQPIRRIAVGIDDSNAAAVALDWAADEAYRHGAKLTVVHAWQRLGQTLRSVDRDRAKAHRILDDAVDRCATRIGRAVSRELVDGPAIPALAAAGMHADLIAVGSRGSSGFKTMLFGPVARFMLANADCPVAVIHPRVRVAAVAADH